MALIDSELFRKRFFALNIEFRPSQIDAIFDCLGDSELATNLQLTCNNDASDLIIKQDVLEEIIRFSTEEGSSVECQKLYCNVNALPSAEQKGKWIDMNTSTTMYMPRYKCSICNKCANKSNFCPHCGARMRGE